MKSNGTTDFPHLAGHAHVKTLKSREVAHRLFSQKNSADKRNKSPEKWNDLSGVSLICKEPK